MLKKLLLTGLVVCLPSYCFSDSIAPYYGTTGNAAAGGHTWSMPDILPAPPGLDINGVFYSYTPNKNTADDMQVHIGNERADGTGDIWRETDDWSGAPGGIEVRRLIGIPNVPREAWGDGSIEVEGNGTVEDASVIYSFKVDPCYNPQYDTNCPGYKLPVPEIETVKIEDLYDATKDDAVQRATTETDKDVYEEDDKAEVKDEDEEDDEKEMRLEAALAAVDNSALFAEAFAQSQILASINLAVNMNSYYVSNIPGGEYKENVVLIDRQINDNKQGLRNGFAQQILHQRMVDMQYNR